MGVICMYIHNNNKFFLVLDEILKKTYIDILTGLYNRNFWERFINGKLEMFKISEYNRLFIIDIDDLKGVNDIEGHLHGDECIREVSNTIKLNLDENDLAIRYGGEEFIVLTMKNEDMAKDFINSVKYNLKNKDIDISIGSTVIDIEEGLRSAFEAADIKMHNEKKDKYSKNILQDIEKLRGKLNILMKSDYKEIYEEVIHVSMKLDNLINKYIKLNKN